MTAIHYPRPSSPSDQLTKEVLNFINDVCDDFCHDLFPQIGIDPMPSTFDWSDSNQWEYSYLTRPKVNGNIPLGDDFWICPKIAEPFAFMCCNHGKCDSCKSFPFRIPLHQNQTNSLSVQSTLINLLVHLICMSR